MDKAFQNRTIEITTAELVYGLDVFPVTKPTASKQELKSTDAKQEKSPAGLKPDPLRHFRRLNAIKMT